MPYTIHKIREDGSVEVKDMEYSKVFSVKGKEMRAFSLTKKAFERMSLVLASLKILSQVSDLKQVLYGKQPMI